MGIRNGLIAVIVMAGLGAGALFVLRARVRSSARVPGSGDAGKEVIFADLRADLLTRSRVAFGLHPPSFEAPVWGVLMETGLPEGTATLVSMIDGSAILYFSSDGRVIGGGYHENVRRAASDFVRLTSRHVADMVSVTKFPLPRTGQTVFYALTDRSVLSAEAAEQALGEDHHKLSPLFYAGQEVITSLRLLSESR